MTSEPKQYRGRTSRGQVIATAGAILLCVGIALSQTYWIYEGITTGAIESLARRSHGLVYLARDPGWFRFNIFVRFSLVILSVSGGILLRRTKLRDELRDL